MLFRTAKNIARKKPEGNFLLCLRCSSLWGRVFASVKTTLWNAIRLSAFIIRLPRVAASPKHSPKSELHPFVSMLFDASLQMIIISPVTSLICPKRSFFMPATPQKEGQTVTPAGKSIKPMIAGVKLRPAVTIPDERGTLCEVYNPA